MAKQTTSTAKNAQPKGGDDEAQSGLFVLISTTNRSTRRRAGLRFTPEGVRVDASTLTEGQRQAIRDDPVLKVKELPAAGD